ncbi:MAG: PorT family protein [Candidatus Aminicenantes bacterium]|nr:PorT family protein [Candidatus Aminicenantes bacterium]
MKKFLFILLSLIVVSQLSAQDFKFIQGISLSRYAIEPDVFVDALGDEYRYDINNVKGFIIGTGIELALASNISTEIDALFYQKGSIIVLPLPPAPYLEWNYTLTVFSFPVLLKIRPLDEPPVYILCGGEFSFVASHKSNDKYITDVTKDIDYGVVAGGGFEIKMKNNSLFFEIRYHLGLKNITKNWTLHDSVKTNSIAFIIAFKVG